MVGGQSSFRPEIFVPNGQRYDTAPMKLAAEQVKHFNLWNFIAIDRNSTKAAQSTPNVGVLRSLKNRQHLNVQQRNHVSQFYSGTVRSSLQDLEPAPDNHPLVELLQRINTEDWWQSFAYETYMMLQLTGAFVWWVVPNGFGLPAELWVIPTQWVQPIFNEKTGELLHWKISPYGDSTKSFTLPPDEIIRGMKKNPLSKINPLSPSQGGAEWIVGGEKIERARALTYANGPLQSLILEMDPAVFSGKVDPTLITQVGDKFIQRFSTGVEGMNRPIVTPPGISTKGISVEPNKMLLPETADQLRDNVLALHGVPKGAVGLSHDLNKANLLGAILSWCQNAIMPMQAFVAGLMTEKLASRYDENLRVWFDDCSPHDEEAERIETELDWRMGALTPDERRMSRSREPLNTPASQDTYIPANMFPLNSLEESKNDDKKQSQQQRQFVEQQSSPHQRDGKREQRLLQQFHRLHGREERQSLSVLRQFWNTIREKVEQRIEADGGKTSLPTVDELLPSYEFRELFNKSMRFRWINSAISGADFEAAIHEIDLRENQSIQQDVSPSEVDVEFSPQLQRKIAEFASSREDGVWKQVLTTTRDRLSDEISTGLSEGDDIRQLTKRVSSVLKKSKQQSVRIARTESTASLNFGQHAVRESHGIKNKQWIATFDNNTRDTHMTADLQTSENGSPFIVGGAEMMHPGDGSLGAPPEEIVMCRCTAVGVK